METQAGRGHIVRSNPYDSRLMTNETGMRWSVRFPQI
jgi:hypothetical protein